LRQNEIQKMQRLCKQGDVCTQKTILQLLL
jgi:hypothetical protein